MGIPQYNNYRLVLAQGNNKRFVHCKAQSKKKVLQRLEETGKWQLGYIDTFEKYNKKKKCWEKLKIF